MAQLCWSGGISFETCCDLRLGPEGDPNCWHDGYNFDACCLSGEELGLAQNTILNCGVSKTCRWATPDDCWNTSVHALSRAAVRQPQQDFSERCVELCCGGLVGLLSRTAVRRSFKAVTSTDQSFKPPKLADINASGQPTPRLGATSRKCHLHTESALFCEYENLCVSFTSRGASIVFLRDNGTGEQDIWTPITLLQSRLAFNDARLASVMSEQVHKGALSVVLPGGFWWPGLDTTNTMTSSVVGWSQPLAHAIGPGAATRSRPSERLGYDSPPLRDTQAVLALLLGLDPAVGPRNIFHFAQLVLPVLAARVRLSWGSGAGFGAGLLEPPAAFDRVVLADPAMATELPWQRGLLELVIGIPASDPRVFEVFGGAAHYGDGLRCFRHVVLPGNGKKDRAVPTTGPLDHAVLLSEAARILPGGLLPRGRGRLALGQDIAVVLRKHGMSRMALNEELWLRSIQATVVELSGQDFGVPSVRELRNLERISFADQVRIFSSSGLLIGVTGAGLTNMIFMPPKSVVIIVALVGSRDYYASMAFGCGHLGFSLPTECEQDPRTPDFAEMSGRKCWEISECLAKVNNNCNVTIDLCAFLPMFASSFSFAFDRQIQTNEFESARVVSMSLGLGCWSHNHIKRTRV